MSRIPYPSDERVALEARLLADEQAYKYRAYYANLEARQMLRDQAMLLLAMRHSLREIELARLNVENLSLSADGENSTLRVFGKRSKFRTIHLVPQTHAALQKWLQARIATIDRAGTARSIAARSVAAQPVNTEVGHG